MTYSDQVNFTQEVDNQEYTLRNSNQDVHKNTRGGYKDRPNRIPPAHLQYDDAVHNVEVVARATYHNLCHVDSIV